MLRDLLDALRCPHDHEESWLVAMVSRSSGPVLIEAELACPVCGAEFPVREGIAHFGAVMVGDHTQAIDLDPERLAALLGVAGGQQPLLLTGRYVYAGAALDLLTETPQLWLDAPVDAPAATAHVSCIQGAPRLPLGVDTLAAAAIDGPHTASAMLESIVRAVRRGGRIVAPVATPLPATLRELARDDREWVAETTTRASGLVELRRREA